jgi:hypothetical protein
MLRRRAALASTTRLCLPADLPIFAPAAHTYSRRSTRSLPIGPAPLLTHASQGPAASPASCLDIAQNSAPPSGPARFHPHAAALLSSLPCEAPVLCLLVLLLPHTTEGVTSPASCLVNAPHSAPPTGPARFRSSATMRRAPMPWDELGLCLFARPRSSRSQPSCLPHSSPARSPHLPGLVPPICNCVAFPSPGSAIRPGSVPPTHNQGAYPHPSHDQPALSTRLRSPARSRSRFRPPATARLVSLTLCTGQHKAPPAGPTRFRQHATKGPASSTSCLAHAQHSAPPTGSTRFHASAPGGSPRKYHPLPCTRPRLPVLLSSAHTQPGALPLPRQRVELGSTHRPCPDPTSTTSTEPGFACQNPTSTTPTEPDFMYSRSSSA